MHFHLLFSFTISLDLLYLLCVCVCFHVFGDFLVCFWRFFSSLITTIIKHKLYDCNSLRPVCLVTWIASIYKGNLFFLCGTQDDAGILEYKPWGNYSKNIPKKKIFLVEKLEMRLNPESKIGDNVCMIPQRPLLCLSWREIVQCWVHATQTTH